MGAPRLEQPVESRRPIARHDLSSERLGVHVVREHRPRMGVEAADRADGLDRIPMEMDEAGLGMQGMDRLEREEMGRILEQPPASLRPGALDQTQHVAVEMIGGQGIRGAQEPSVAGHPVLDVELQGAEGEHEDRHALLGLGALHGMDRLIARREPVDETKHRIDLLRPPVGSVRRDRVEALVVGQGTVRRIPGQQAEQIRRARARPAQDDQRGQRLDPLHRIVEQRPPRADLGPDQAQGVVARRQPPDRVESGLGLDRPEQRRVLLLEGEAVEPGLLAAPPDPSGEDLGREPQPARRRSEGRVEHPGPARPISARVPECHVPFSCRHVGSLLGSARWVSING